MERGDWAGEGWDAILGTLAAGVDTAMEHGCSSPQRGLRQRSERKALRVLFGLLAAGCLLQQAPAATRTVCASGCDHSSVQAALDAAEGGEIIEVAAGEVFTENLELPHKWSPGAITVRSSRWAELPPKGYRVNPEEHAALMPKIQPADYRPVLRSGVDGNRVQQDGVDTVNDTITFEARIPVGTWVSCGGLELPSPLTYGTPYTVTGRNGTTVKLGHGGDWPEVDLTGTGSAGESGYYSRPFCTPWFAGSNYRFLGLDFSTRTELYTNILVQIGWDEAAAGSTPHNIEFDRVLVRGLPDENGPRFCMALNGRDISVTDSWIGHCKAIADESKAISLVNSPGPTLIENNYLAGASIGILTAGQGSAVHERVATDLSIVNNHIAKPGYMLYKSGAGPPGGACYYGNGSGSFYRDTSVEPNTCADGACYECQPDGTWARNTGAAYRNAHYLPKSGIELKDCERCMVEGNVVEGVFAANDTGNMYCVLVSQLSQGGLYHYIGNTVVRNNWCKDTWSGLVTATDGSGFTTRNHDIRFENNLATGMANFPAMSIHANPNEAQVRPVGLWMNHDCVVFDHNTFRPAPGMTYDAHFAVMLVGSRGTITDTYLTNNLIQAQRGWVYMDGDYTCGTDGFGKYFGTAASPNYWANNVLYRSTPAGYFTGCNPVQNLVADSVEDVAFVSDDDSRLQPTSPYSASCTSGCAFPATDGTDVGADIDILEEAISGVVAGTPRWSVQANLRVDAGSDRAVIRYTAPDSNACTLHLYTAAARTAVTEHPDTRDAGQSVDARAGNVFNGVEREFLLGYNAALAPDTEYHYMLRCGDRAMPGRFRTGAAGPQP